MAGGIVEVLLKIIGDSRDADRKLEETGRKADQTKGKVDEVDQAVTRTSTRLTRLTGAIAAAASRLSATLVAGEVIGQTIDDLTGAQGRISRGERAVQEAGSLDELARRFRDQVQNRTTGFGESGGLPGLLKNVGVTLGRMVTFRDPGVEFKTEREALEYFDELARSQPNRARALLGQDLGELNYLKPQFAARLARITDTQTQAKTLDESLKPGQTVNVYTSIYAGGGRGSVGRQIKAATDIRDRNNGRYVTTFRR